MTTSARLHEGSSLNLIHHSLDGSRPIEYSLERAYILGFTVRDQEKMKRHLAEVEGLKLEWPERPPVVFPLGTWAVTTAETVTVQFPTTTGEVEIVLLTNAEDELLIGVGSDHTDRELEKHGIAWSKQVTPNVLAPSVWSWTDVADHWDALEIESFVGQESDTMEVYQRGKAAEFWSPHEILDSVKGRLVHANLPSAYYIGTVEAIGNKLRSADWFTFRLIDPVLGRRIQHTYRVVVLSEEIAH